MPKQRRNFLILTGLSVLYIAIFIPLNLRCSGDHNMLLCAGSDEYVQYPCVIRMTMRGTTALGTFKKVLDHKHYYYGYPFYFVSAATIAPIRILSEFRDTNYTRAYVLTLRQLSPLFMAATIMLLVAMWTGFHSLPSPVSLFLFLAAIPSVFLNNTWWHPDSMVTFFVVATLFCLSRDNLRFGKWFLFSALTCGLAASTKVLGLFFALCIPAYLLLGVCRRQITLAKAIRGGAMFVFLMVITVMITYPVLFVPHKAEAVWATLQRQSEMNNFGWGIKMERGPLAHYTETLRHYFGIWPMYVIGLVLGISGILNSDRRRSLLSYISLAWCIPYISYLLFVVARKSPYYFIPGLLPFFPIIWNAFFVGASSRTRLLLRTCIGIVLVVQFALYLPVNYKTYVRLARQERESPSLRFYADLMKHGILSPNAKDIVTVFRDPYVYLPPIDAFDQSMKWGAADYSNILDFRPDIIILQTLFIDNHSDPKRVARSFDKDQARKSLSFYQDAKEDEIEGYREVFRSEFAVAFKRIEGTMAPNTH